MKKKQLLPQENVMDFNIDDYDKYIITDDNKLIDNVEYKRNIDELSNIYESLDSNLAIAKPLENEGTRQDTLIEATKILKIEAERLNLDKAAVNTFTDNAEVDRDLKKKYAGKLLWILVLQLAIFNLIFVLVGLNILVYEYNTINIYVTGGLIEIISLVAIVVRYLFKDNISKPLRDILEKNKKDK